MEQRFIKLWQHVGHIPLHSLLLRLSVSLQSFTAPLPDEAEAAFVPCVCQEVGSDTCRYPEATETSETVLMCKPGYYLKVCCSYLLVETETQI